MAKVERNSNLRSIAKELGIVGANPTNQFDFASQADTGLRNQAVSATGSEIALDTPNLMKAINERLRTSGPATIRNLRDMFGDQIGDQGTVAPAPNVSAKLQNIKQLQQAMQQQQLEQSADQGVNPFIPTTPGGTPMIPVEQSTVETSGLQDFLSKLGRATTVGLREGARLTPIGAIPEAMADRVVGDADNTLARLISNTGKAVKQDVFKETTIEEEAIKALSEKFPDLAEQKDKKGLAKFAGAGEIRIKGQRYFVDEKGKLNKVGAGSNFLERLSKATKPKEAPISEAGAGIDIPETGETLQLDGGNVATQISQLVSDAQAAIQQGADPNKVKERLAQLINQLQAGAK